MLTRDQILAADDLPREEVQTPEWGGSVYVRTMNGRERERYEKAHILRAKTDNEDRDVMTTLLAGTVCDADGTLLLSYDDVEQLSKKNGNVLSRLFVVATRLNPLFGTDIEKVAKN